MRVLVVDDDFVSRVKLSKLLAKLGCCDHSPNGDIAIRLFEAAHAESAPYGLVTMDIEMPDLSGQDVVFRMRDLERSLGIPPGPAVKILMVTARTAVKDIFSCYYEGCDGYVMKPITPDEIAGAIAKLGV